MKYKFLILLSVASMAFGALLHAWLGKRYRVFAAGNGVVMKVDEWTGHSWVKSAEWRDGYTTGAFFWKPVDQ